jgi:lysyl-tRNA synthetase class I
MNADLIERRFTAFMAEQGWDGVVDDETATILRAINADLFPSRTPSPLTYSDVMALAGCNPPKSEWDLWDFITLTNGYRPQDNAMLDAIVSGVYNYYREHRAPHLVFRTPNEFECLVLRDLIATVNTVKNANPQNLLAYLEREVYEVGKRAYLPDDIRDEVLAIPVLDTSGMTDEAAKAAKKAHKDQYGALQAKAQEHLRSFFAMVYGVVLGQTDGPRLPNFILLMGMERFNNHIKGVLDAL